MTGGVSGRDRTERFWERWLVTLKKQQDQQQDKQSGKQQGKQPGNREGR